MASPVLTSTPEESIRQDLIAEYRRLARAARRRARRASFPEARVLALLIVLEASQAVRELEAAA